MKSKNAFESSGNSPTTPVKVSENGAPVLTGRGLEDVKRRIMESFEKIRLHKPAPTPSSPIETITYTEEHEVHFHTRAKKLTLVALGSARISKTLRGNIFQIVVPVESAEELIKEALLRFK